MRMLRHLAFLPLALALTTAACDDDDPVEPPAETYRATLSGANESPPVTTPAQGTATFTVTGNSIAYNVQITGWPANQTVSGAHIHCAPVAPQTTCGVLLGWTPGTITTTGGQGTIQATDAHLTAIRAGGTYFNVHGAPDFTGGLIRGPLIRQ